MKMQILQGDLTTPSLKSLQAALKPGSKESLKLRQSMAFNAETLTRDHIVKAAKTRHKTANRLSATQTGYLSKKAESIESHVTGNADGLIKLTVVGDIFKRVDGAVPIKPRLKKWLAIPNTAEAYGKRPGEISGLSFRKFKNNLAALVRVSEEKDALGRPKFDVIFWLKKGVTLPQDRGLLPVEGEYMEAFEKAADDYLAALAKRAAESFTAGGRNSPA